MNFSKKSASWPFASIIITESDLRIEFFLSVLNGYSIPLRDIERIVDESSIFWGSRIFIFHHNPSVPKNILMEGFRLGKNIEQAISRYSLKLEYYTV